MINITSYQFTTSTAQDQSNYFNKESNTVLQGQLGDFVELLPGNYRIIDGELFRISSYFPLQMDIK
jgi:hypothetical protein